MSSFDVQGTCYLLHFSEPYKHAAHYLGFTTDLKGRLAQHESGNGARLLQVAKAARITWTLARTWQGTRARERQIKNMGGLRRRCPQCGVKPREERKMPKRIDQAGAADAESGRTVRAADAVYATSGYEPGQPRPAEPKRAPEADTARLDPPATMKATFHWTVHPGDHASAPVPDGAYGPGNPAPRDQADGHDQQAGADEPRAKIGDPLASYIRAGQRGAIPRQYLADAIRRLAGISTAPIIRDEGAPRTARGRQAELEAGE